MRALVTGASGFVGGYLTAALREAGAHVVGCGGPGDSGDVLPVDLLDGDSLRGALESARPDVVYHLAARTFVPDSFASPLVTYDANAMGCARLAQAVREYAQAGGAMPRIVFTSSAEVYGARELHDFPLHETLDPRPATPYAASKAAGEAMLLAEARSLGLDVVVARAFNHIGPGQSDRFAVAGFALQLARIARGAEPVLLVGNLEAARDILDVRDVVRAYVMLAGGADSGEIYNVCRGTAVKMREVLRQLITVAHVPVEVRDDPQRMRPLDVPLFVGSARKLSDRTGWSPRHALASSLQDVYRDALDRVDAGKARPAS